MIAKFSTETINQFTLVIDDEVLEMINLLLVLDGREFLLMFVQEFLKERQFSFPQNRIGKPVQALAVHL